MKKQALNLLLICAILLTVAANTWAGGKSDKSLIG